MSWLSIASLLLTLVLLVLLTNCASSLTKGTPVLGATEWRSTDGKVMPCTAWLPASHQTPRAVVIAVHGLSGAKSDFWYLGEHLSAANIAVHAYDLRGQGHDPIPRQHGDLRSSQLWLRDLQTFHELIRQRYPATPVFWYGESLGGLICLHSATQPQAKTPRGLILASPAAGLREAFPKHQRALLHLGRWVAPRHRVRLGELTQLDEAALKVTSTTTHGQQMTVTSHHVERFSLRLLVAIGRLMDRAGAAAQTWQPPLLMLASPHDVVAAPQQIQHLFDQVASREKNLHWYQRSHHLLLHDVQREQVAQDVLTWLNDQLRNPTHPTTASPSP
jgi:alpha-beta hydrolase superfamily lysophospholipase